MYDGCPLGFKHDHFLYLISFPPSSTPPLNSMCS